MYYSETAFIDRFKVIGLDGRKFQFIFLASDSKDRDNPRVYKDNYMGIPRYFDYLDSLTGLFQWDRAIALRLNTFLDKQRVGFQPMKNSSIILLGRDKLEAKKLEVFFTKELHGYSAGSYECYDDDYYPWCFIEFK